MALLVEHDVNIPYAIRIRIAFHVSVIVLLTLIINGTTVTTLYKKLKVYHTSEHHLNLLRASLLNVEVACQPARRDLRGHWFFCNCYYEVLGMLTISFDETKGEISLEDDGAGHELIKINPKPLNKGFCLLTEISAEKDMKERLEVKHRYQKRWGDHASAHNVLLKSKNMTSGRPNADLHILRQNSMPPGMEARFSKTVRRAKKRRPEKTIAWHRWKCAVNEIVAVMRIMHEMNNIATEAEAKASSLNKRSGKRDSLDLAGTEQVTGHHNRAQRKTTLGVQMRKAVLNDATTFA